MRSTTLVMLAGLSLLAGCTASGDEATEDAVDETGSALTSNSALWGADGEKWTPTSRLFDYSYAGYHSGEAAIPDVAVTANVRDFGALGDGTHDDSQAFIDAIAKTTSGAIRIPAGKYLITKRILLTKSNVVLRGDGPTLTTLEFPKSLAEIDGKDPSTFTNPSPYSFGDNYLQMKGSDAGTTVANVTVGVKRGAKTLTLSTTSGLTAGKWVTLAETDVSNTLAQRMYGDKADPGTDLTGDPLVNFRSRITSISGNTITLERPVPVDVETRWAPQIRTFAPRVTEAGIEHLTIHFKGTDYRGHFLEAGFNAISLSGMVNSWVRDVKIVNADLGVTVNGSTFCTVTGVVTDTDYDRGAKFHKDAGHHALWVSGRSSDMLFSEFDIRKPFVHDLSTEGASIGAVFARGKGTNINMDHHRNAPYATLFTNLDLGTGTRPFDSGGSDFRGAHSASFSAFWGLRSASAFKLPTADFGPQLTFVGVNTSATSAPDAGWFLEPIAPTSLAPVDIQAAMQHKRTGK